MKQAMDKGEKPPSKKHTPFPVMVGKGAAHCGTGCTLGDIWRNGWCSLCRHRGVVRLALDL